jgi:hypothetical protein
VASIGANSCDPDNIAETKDVCTVLLLLPPKKVLSLTVATVHNLDRHSAGHEIPVILENHEAALQMFTT